MSDSETEWFANEAFWQATYSSMFPEARFTVAPSEVEQIVALTGCSEGRVLDLACGPGRHSVAFAQRGFGVTGVDRSQFFLGRAREHAHDAGVNVEWVESDMRSFRRPHAFDLAICLFTAFGYFRDAEENQQVLANVAASLEPGGAFVLDVLGKELLARRFSATTSNDVPEGVLVQRHEIIDDWTRIRNEWILLRDDAPHTFRFSHWLYSARELKEMFGRAGFVDVQVYGDLAGAGYGVNATRLIVVGRTARKKG